MENNQYKEKLAQFLLQIKAIQLNLQNPFTWTSGIQSPIYCDNRKLLSYPEIRTYVKDGMMGLVSEYFAPVDVIAGVATAGIPLGSILADALDLPFIYVRNKPKEHGLSNTIEGVLAHGQRVLVIEDTISTGGSSLKAVDDIRLAGGEVVGMIAIYKYGFESTKQRFEDAGVLLKTLLTYDLLIRVAEQENYITREDIQSLQNWRSQPEKWNK